MATTALDRTVRITEETIFRELAGEAVLLQLRAGMYFGLDTVGTRLWQLIAEHGDLRRVFAQAREEFDVDDATLERDLLALVDSLVSRDLVVVE
jgi:hypothetical protein